MVETARRSRRRSPRSPAGTGGDGRDAAAWLVQSVLAGGRTLAELRADKGGRLAALGQPEQARALRLAAATLRHLDRADALLAPCLRKPPPEPVHSILRVAVTELMQFGAPAHGVVNAAVARVRGGAGGRPKGGLREAPGSAALAGLVNAVLRKVSEQTPARWSSLPPQRLPAWLRSRLVTAWGAAAVAAIECAHAEAAALDLTLRDGTCGDDWAQRLGAVRLPTGSLRLRVDDMRAVSSLPGYAEGAWWVQDAAAALPVRLLDPRPGERILDLCAAPGGKTMQLAAAGADVTALDLSPARLGRLRENLRRTGLSARVLVGDALAWVPDQPFDAIVLDAPCSASGTIRRHPDMPFARGPRDLKPLVAMQAALLERVLDPAAGLLRAGGRVLYCTCSVLPEEGEAQIARVLRRQPGLRLESGAPAGVPAQWHAPQGGLRLRPDYWPEHGGIDGFYMALLRFGGAAP